MKRYLIVLGCLSVVFGSGCTDGPAAILRDEKNLAVEAADALTKVRDEASAKYVVEVVVPKLKSKWEQIQTRRGKYIKAADKDNIKEFSRLQGGESYKREFTNSRKRLQDEKSRVAAISISDSKVQSKINNYESELFGSKGLSIPDDPDPEANKKGPPMGMPGMPANMPGMPGKMPGPPKQ
jgi:hypothetical protein